MRSIKMIQARQCSFSYREKLGNDSVNFVGVILLHTVGSLETQFDNIAQSSNKIASYKLVDITSAK